MVMIELPPTDPKIDAGVSQTLEKPGPLARLAEFLRKKPDLRGELDPKPKVVGEKPRMSLKDQSRYVPPGAHASE